MDKTETINSTQGNSVLVYKHSSRDANNLGDIRIFTGTKIPLVEHVCCYFGKAFSIQSDQNVGRTYFPKGYLPKASTSKSPGALTGKKCAKKVPGVILCLLM